MEHLWSILSRNGRTGGSLKYREKEWENGEKSVHNVLRDSGGGCKITNLTFDSSLHLRNICFEQKDISSVPCFICVTPHRGKWTQVLPREPFFIALVSSHGKNAEKKNVGKHFLCSSSVVLSPFCYYLKMILELSICVTWWARSQSSLRAEKKIQFCTLKAHIWTATRASGSFCPTYDAL